ncbi:hypothetical protein LguiA_021284 [Lonicera macranthoides]
MEGVEGRMFCVVVEAVEDEGDGEEGCGDDGEGDGKEFWGDGFLKEELTVVIC